MTFGPNKPLPLEDAIDLIEDAKSEDRLWPREACDSAFYWAGQEQDEQARHLARAVLDMVKTDGK